MPALMSVLSMQVTYQCNIACRHCGPYCDPQQTEWMTVDEIRDVIRQAAELGAETVVFTGGEPTLLKQELTTLLKYLHFEMSISNSRIVSNAKFASSYDRAKRLLAEWQEAGLKELNFSCGEYHQEFIPVEYVTNAYRAACDLGYRAVLLAGEFLDNGKGKITPEMFERALGEPLPNANMRSPYSSATHGMTRHGAMAYGRGHGEVPLDGIKWLSVDKIRSTCDDVNSVITVHPNGNVTACCGIMVRDDSLLTIGNWRDTPLREIVSAAHDDVILNWIHSLGLRDMKKWLESKDPTLNLRSEYQNICDLCAEIVYNERCQKILIEHGAERSEAVLAARVATEAMNSPEFVYRDPVEVTE